MTSQLHQQMEYRALKGLFEDQPLLRLFRRQDPAMLIGFLYQEFKRSERISIDYEDFILDLSIYIEENGIYIADSEENQNSDFSRSEVLVRQWCHQSNRFLRRFLDDQGRVMVELTPHSERAIRMVEDMRRADYVATESRFTDILHRLRRLARDSIVDPEEKIADLIKQRAEINRQLKAIRASQSVQSLDTRQIEESLFEIGRSARDLLADFKAVEENFREILSRIYHDEVEQHDSKGRILKGTLDAASELQDTPQGKSFHAFWDFLVTDYGNDEINTLVDVIFTIIRERSIETSDTFLWRLKPYLLNAGKRIIDSNRRLSERLNRIIVGPQAEGSRKLLEEIAAVKKMVLDCKDNLPSADRFLTVESNADITLPLERPLQSPEEATSFDLPDQGDYESPDFKPLLSLFAVDYALLRSNIHAVLAERPSASLEVVLDRFPPQKGLAEIVAYLDVANRDPRAIFGEDEFRLPYTHAGIERTVSVPRVVFSRPAEMSEGVHHG